MQHPDVPYQLLTILQYYAPNGAAQQQASDIYNEMFKEGQATKEIACHLSGILHDGLRSGNWPWNK
jgi:hypothetical protein